MSFWKKKPEPDFSSATDRNSGQNPLILEKSGDNGNEKTTPSGEGTGSPVAMGTDEILNERFGKTRSALSAGTVIQGKLSFDTPVRIDGKLSGEVYSSKALIIGPTGQVDAVVDVACLVVLGTLRGNAKTTERVEIWSGGTIEGDVTTPTLVVQEGGVFSGGCSMVNAQKGAAASREYKVSEARSSGTASSAKSSGSGEPKDRFSGSHSDSGTGDKKTSGEKSESDGSAKTTTESHLNA